LIGYARAYEFCYALATRGDLPEICFTICYIAAPNCQRTKIALFDHTVQRAQQRGLSREVFGPHRLTSGANAIGA
jgi:hypothetical protein